MRRLALLAATLTMPATLGGCGGSGAYAFLGNTFTLPGANPNIAQGSSETYLKVRAKQQPSQDPPPILFEAGDVWPDPPKAPPTLKDLQRQQNQEIGATGAGDQGYAPLAPLPQLPGYEVPQQDIRRPSPTQTFPGGVVQLPNGQGNITGGNRGMQTLNGPTGNGSIVVPNGNGTSTVIGPTGNVTTIPTPGK